MYEIIEENSLAHFKSKIINSQHDYDSEKRHKNNFVDSIGRFHKTFSFRIDNDGTIDLLYKNRSNNDTFKITTRFARLNYSIRLEKSNVNYSLAQNNMENEDNIITRKNIRLVGITVGDLLKHFYHINIKVHKIETELTLDEDENENDKMIKLVKKSLSIDTSNARITNVLGKYHSKRGTFHLWENLEKYIDKGESDFTGFCNKILFLTERLFNKVNKFYYNKENNKENEKVVFDEKYYQNFFNNLTNKAIVERLLKYYMYNEYPENGLYSQNYYFEEPTLVPEILKYLYEKYNDNVYMEQYNLVMKPLNTGQTQELEKRYKPTVFKSIQNVNKEYPLYAFRNIYLTEWSSGDLFELKYHYGDYMRSVKNQKYKYKSGISDKVIPMNKRFYYKYRYRFDEEGMNSKKELQDMIQEELLDFEY